MTYMSAGEKGMLIAAIIFGLCGFGMLFKWIITEIIDHYYEKLEEQQIRNNHILYECDIKGRPRDRRSCYTTWYDAKGRPVNEYGWFENEGRKR